jgi:hypothetical protein
VRPATSSIADEIDAVFLRDVVNRDDARMVQRRRGPRFLDEPAPAIGVADLVGGKDLDRDEPVQVRVARFVDDAHAAFADAVEDLVVREPAADHWWVDRSIYAAGRRATAASVSQADAP